MHAIGTLTIFVPVGHSKSATKIYNALPPTVVGNVAGEVLAIVYEYFDVNNVKKIAKDVNHLIITNPNVISCGNFYTDKDLYQQAMCDVFRDSNCVVMDINPTLMVHSDERVKLGSTGSILFSDGHDMAYYIGLMEHLAKSIINAPKFEPASLNSEAIKHIGTKLIKTATDIWVSAASQPQTK